MSNSIVKDVRVDTTDTRFFPIVNFYNGKSIIIQNGKPNEWKTVDELIDFYQVGQTLFINDINSPYSEINRSSLDKLFKQFNCWYSSQFTKPDEANLILDKGVERVVYKFDQINKSVIDSIDNEKLAISFSLPKRRNTENDNKLFEKLKDNCKYIKYLILNLNQDYNSKEVIETTTQIYDLFRKNDELEDVKMGVNARNIFSRSELQLLISSGVDPHIGYPIHNNLLSLGEIYSLLLNDILQSNYLNLPNNSLPYYPTILQDIDGNVYQTYYSTKNSLEKTINKRYAVYWSRELRREFKMVDHKIKHIYFSQNKTSLLFVVDKVGKKEKTPIFDKYRNPVRRRLDWIDPMKKLNITDGEFIKESLFDSINTNSWSDTFQHLVNLININGDSLPEILDKTICAPIMNYPVDNTFIKHIFLYKNPFNETDDKLTIVTNCEYYAKNWLKISGLNYDLITVDNSDNDLIKKFNDSVFTALFLRKHEVTDESFEVKSDQQLVINSFLYYQFNNSIEIVEESDDHIIKKVDDYYLSLFKKDSYRQYILLEQLDIINEYPFIKSEFSPSDVKVKVNENGYVLFQRKGVTISDDEAKDYFYNLVDAKEKAYILFNKVKKPFVVDLNYNDLTINYIKLV